MGERYRDFCVTLVPHTGAASRVVNIPHQSGTCTNSPKEEPTLTSHQSPAQSLCFRLGFILGDIHSAGLDKCTVAYIHHYSIIQSIFIALHVLSILPIPLPSPTSHPTPATTDLYIVSIILIFPEWHIVEIIQYVAFLD